MEETQHSQPSKIQIDVLAGVSLICAALMCRGGFGCFYGSYLCKSMGQALPLSYAGE